MAELTEAFPNYYKYFSGFQEYEQQDTAAFKPTTYADFHDNYILEKLELEAPPQAVTQSALAVQDETPHAMAHVTAPQVTQTHRRGGMVSCAEVQYHLHKCSQCNMKAYWSNMIDIFSYIALGFFFAWLYFNILRRKS